ncbi:DUF881 domain-containing protein [Modestobacter italicus]|uniref:DUF881 domain-containing protein n=1 Tax=Modestobacter italicus (strain DSM 44449 / CECT 9708 / BC 501) TaxID=2732864 RepID=UPI001C946834|nr:DUF881 domain-containing protein [Modestobacter italicus]
MSSGQQPGRWAGQGPGRRPGRADDAGTPGPAADQPAGTEPVLDQPDADRPAAHEPDGDAPVAGWWAPDGAAEERSAGSEPPDEPSGSDGTATAPRRRRDPLAALLIGVLTLLLGFAFAVQVRNTDTDQALVGAREEDLVRILDDLTAQQDRLRQEIFDQRTALEQLGNSDSAAAAALAEAQQRAETLGILNGTVPAQGEGLIMTIRDPQDAVTVADVLNAIQELRGAGAETMQINDVRIGVSSAVTGKPGDLAIDGIPIESPYVFEVIGSPQDMATAMNIPGGVSSSVVNRRQGSVDIVQSEQVVVDALRPLDEPQYAEPRAGD